MRISDWSSNVCSSDLVPAHGADNHFKGSDCSGPDYALLVVVLFDGGSGNTADAYAIAAHLQHRRLAVGFQKGGTQRFGVFVAQEKNMADLDASLYGQLAALRSDESPVGKEVVSTFEFRGSRYP